MSIDRIKTVYMAVIDTLERRLHRARMEKAQGSRVTKSTGDNEVLAALVQTRLRLIARGETGRDMRAQILELIGDMDHYAISLNDRRLTNV